jgi:hypothetical protein
MLFFVEGNSEWAFYLNKTMLKCHEKLQEHREYKYNIYCEDDIIEESIILDDIFLNIAADIESCYDFNN